jgi:ATP-dependent Lon protease
MLEATRVAGSGRLIPTGQLGVVMKESTQAALRLIWLETVDDAVAAALGERPRRPAGEFKLV